MDAPEKETVEKETVKKEIMKKEIMKKETMKMEMMKSEAMKTETDKTEAVKKEDRRVRRTKKLLTQALMQLMQQKQVKEITVRELTDLADINRGTFYLYYKDVYDMIEKLEDGIFDALSSIAALHENDAARQETKPILLDVFRFVEENQEIVRVLLSPHGDMKFLHRLYEILREKCELVFSHAADSSAETDFDYRPVFVIYGAAGLIRFWVNRGCPESAAQMAELADAMIRRGSL